MNKKYVGSLVRILAIVLPVFLMKIDSSAATVSIEREYVSPNGDGSYTVNFIVESEDAYAGEEFCVSCSEGVKVEKVTYDQPVSATAPTVARGYTWFGYYDSENRFTEPVTVTMTVSLSEESEASEVTAKDADASEPATLDTTVEEIPHLILASMKTYRIEEDSYRTEEQIEDRVIFLQRTDDIGDVITPLGGEAEESVLPGKCDTAVIYAGVILAAIGVCIYTIPVRKKRRKEE